jgi:hypothetical protein
LSGLLIDKTEKFSNIVEFCLLQEDRNWLERQKKLKNYDYDYIALCNQNWSFVDLFKGQ